MSRKLEEKQRRRLAEEQRRAEERKAHRRRNLVTLGIALLVGVGVVLLIMNERTVDVGPLGVAADEAGCQDVETIEDATAEHVDEGTDVTYAESPPVGGNHWPTPADATFYTSEIDEERLVHNLEHGQVVIWYRPDISTEVKDDIETYVERENDATLEAGASLGPMLGAPYADIDDSATFVMTAWQASQTCARMSSEAIDDFRVTFQGRGPEQFVPTFTKDEGDAG
jgi:Protein of unknown function (DUF3105)